uniref:Uncharacterized protein n=1 Tax=Meloidogyne incognita TaxID=6306 RepID=A0A914N9H7_MELIC
MLWNNFLNKNKIFVFNGERDRKENKAVKIDQLELLLRQCTEHALTPQSAGGFIPIGEDLP